MKLPVFVTKYYTYREHFIPCDACMGLNLRLTTLKLTTSMKPKNIIFYLVFYQIFTRLEIENCKLKFTFPRNARSC